YSDGCRKAARGACARHLSPHTCSSETCECPCESLCGTTHSHTSGRSPIPEQRSAPSCGASTGPYSVAFSPALERTPRHSPEGAPVSQSILPAIEDPESHCWVGLHSAASPALSAAARWHASYRRPPCRDMRYFSIFSTLLSPPTSPPCGF